MMKIDVSNENEVICIFTEVGLCAKLCEAIKKIHCKVLAIAKTAFKS